MKNRDLKRVFCKIYGVSMAFTSMILITAMLISSAFADYTLIVYTNLYNECYIEIVMMIVGLVCFISTMFEKPTRPRA